MVAETPEPTISEREIVTAECPHCADTTVQVRGGSGLSRDGETYACLQCVADTQPGSGCCSLSPLNRWKETP